MKRFNENLFTFEEKFVKERVRYIIEKDQEKTN